MELFNNSHSCLRDILYKKIPFKLAIKNTCSKNTVFREDRRNLTNVIGCALRHFYIFDYLVNQVRDDFNDDQKVTLYLYLSNVLFVSVFSSKEVEKGLKKDGITNKDVEQLVNLIEDKTKLIPTQYSRESLEYLHYRYNIPEWVLKIWMKHFKGYTFKIVKVINKPYNYYAIVNRSVTTDEQVLAQYEEVKKTEFEGLYMYEGKVAPKRHSLFKDAKMVTISPAEHYSQEKLDLDVFRTIGVYTEVHNNLLLQLMARLGTKYRAKVIAGSLESYYQAKKDIENYKLNQVDLYEAKHNLIVTCVSEKVHTFFVSPKNSSFNEFRKTPDYFNRVNQDELDEMIANQKESLLSASSFVENGGLLVYTVPTMNKKETVQIVDAFLKENKNYSLVEQRQFLPFDKYDSTLFIAIFRNEAKDD